jgi:hypothetical protein
METENSLTVFALEKNWVARARQIGRGVLLSRSKKIKVVIVAAGPISHGEIDWTLRIVADPGQVSGVWNWAILKTNTASITKVEWV